MLEHRLARLESVDSDLEHGKIPTKSRNLIVLARTMSMVNSEERKICMTLQVGEYCNSKFESDL